MYIYHYRAAAGQGQLSELGRDNTSQLSHDCLKEVQHFHVLYRTLHNSVNWREIGLFLGLSPTELDVIQSEQNAVKSCMEKVLLLWLRRIDPKPTKSDILKVLRYLKLTGEAETLERELKL